MNAVVNGTVVVKVARGGNDEVRPVRLEKRGETPKRFALVHDVLQKPRRHLVHALAVPHGRVVQGVRHQNVRQTRTLSGLPRGDVFGFGFG